MMVYEWFENIEFANKWMLPFLGLLPVFVWLRYRMMPALKSSFAVTTAKSFRVRTAQNFWIFFPFIFRLLAIGCVIVALARPQTRNQQRQTTGEGIDIVLCMDVSGSMNYPDMTPSRMEVAKQVAEETYVDPESPTAEAKSAAARPKQKQKAKAPPQQD